MKILLFRFGFLCEISLTRELKVRVVGFVHKKSYIYFEILIDHILFIVQLVPVKIRAVGFVFKKLHIHFEILIL